MVDGRLFWIWLVFQKIRNCPSCSGTRAWWQFLWCISFFLFFLIFLRVESFPQWGISDSLRVAFSSAAWIPGTCAAPCVEAGQFFVYRLQNVHPATGLWWSWLWWIFWTTSFCRWSVLLLEGVCTVFGFPITMRLKHSSIKLQTVKVFFIVLQSVEVDSNMSPILIFITL